MIFRAIDGSEPLRPEPVAGLAGGRDRRRGVRSWHLAVGTLACPACDAPIAPPAGVSTPADPLGCAFCDHAGAVRDFLSLEAPSRPARVDVRVVSRLGRV
jgi:hypothetical protein